MIAGLAVARGVQQVAAMRGYRWALDPVSRDIVAIGRDGRRYTIDELERAIEGAARGEPAALATIRDVELTERQAGA